MMPRAQSRRTVKHGTYRDLISGKKTGPAGGRTALWGLKRCLFLLRGGRPPHEKRAFDLGLLRTHTAPVPVVSIGNLTVGGTGKTPMVAALANWFASHGARPVIFSRGLSVFERDRQR